MHRCVQGWEKSVARQIAALLGAGLVVGSLSIWGLAAAPNVAAAQGESVSDADSAADPAKAPDRTSTGLKRVRGTAEDGEEAPDRVDASDAPTATPQDNGTDVDRAEEGGEGHVASEVDATEVVGPSSDPVDTVVTTGDQEVVDLRPNEGVGRQTDDSSRGIPAAGDKALPERPAPVAHHTQSNAAGKQRNLMADPGIVDSREAVAVDANVHVPRVSTNETRDSSDQSDTAAPVENDTALVQVAGTVVQTPVRPPTLLNVIGSLILNVLVGLIHIADGPPVLPPNSTVSVRTSSLTLPIGNGRKVQADWYFPGELDESTRLVYLQHGFLASGPMYSYTAAELAERTHSIVVAPSLSSNFFAPDAAWVGGSTMHRAVADLFAGERSALTQSASAAAGYTITLPDRFVLVGHSAGGTLVTSAAGFMTETGAIDDLVGIVMLDGVEPSGSRMVSGALGKLTSDNDRPIYLISSDRYFWSRGGDMADKLQLARPDRFNGLGLESGRHGDYIQGGNPVIQFSQYLVNGFSQRENVFAAGLITAGWVNDLFTGSQTGFYGAPHESISIDTRAGAAHATVLPLGEPARPVWNPLLDAALTAIFDFGGRYLFVYEPLLGYQTQSLAPRARTAL